MSSSDVSNAMNYFCKSIESFLTHESNLLCIDVNERSITHKIAEYLQYNFKEWNVDCEYNRLGDKVKTLPKPIKTNSNDTDAKTIFPDIIVHKRGKNENLLVIEVKKVGNTSERSG
jgi:hypothetical protein